MIYELGDTTNDPAVKALDLPQGRYTIKHEVRANQCSIVVHLRYLLLSDDQYDVVTSSGERIRPQHCAGIYRR